MMEMFDKNFPVPACGLSTLVETTGVLVPGLLLCLGALVSKDDLVQTREVFENKIFGNSDFRSSVSKVHKLQI